jgi:hypothetical protein
MSTGLFHGVRRPESISGVPRNFSGGGGRLCIYESVDETQLELLIQNQI